MSCRLYEGRRLPSTPNLYRYWGGTHHLPQGVFDDESRDTDYEYLYLGKAAEGFYYNVNWRWGFGTFAIIIPVVTFPLFAVLKLGQRKAEKRGILIREPSGRTVLQSIWHVVVEFDGRFPPTDLISPLQCV